MSSTADIRKGLCIRLNNDIYKVIDFLHVKPGKGPAFVRTKIKSLSNGKVLDNTFSSGHKIEEVRVELIKFQYLYEDKDKLYFMNTQDYNSIEISKELVDKFQFLKEGQLIDILCLVEEGTPLSVEFPSHIILKVSSCDPGVKGNTVANAYKSALLETGAKIQVPLFINQGDEVKIHVETGSYTERVNTKKNK